MPLQAAFRNKPDAKAALSSHKENVSLMELQTISDNLENDSLYEISSGKACIIFHF